MSPVLTIAGPTASGKSPVALELAVKIGGEIVNADSRQIYRFLNAGTSRPGAGERRKVPHHLYDFLDPKEIYSAGDYARDASKAISGILSRKKKPIVVGGTGLYIRALFDGLSNMPQRDDSVREDLMSVVRQKGKKALHEMLAKADPVSASKIPYQNVQRTLRALEVYRITGKPLSQWHKESPPVKTGLEPLLFGLGWAKDALRKRIAERCEKILPGIIAETESLLAMGYEETAPGLQSLGYRHAALFLRKGISRAELLVRLTRDTLAYAKRQETWFKKDARIRWIKVREPFDPSAAAEEIMRSVMPPDGRHPVMML